MVAPQIELCEVRPPLRLRLQAITLFLTFLLGFDTKDARRKRKLDGYACGSTDGVLTPGGQGSHDAPIIPVHARDPEPSRLSLGIGGAFESMCKACG
jgi:hypothetical protein